MYHNKKIEEIEKELNTNEKGLKEEEAVRRVKENGKNEIPKGKQRTILDILIEQVKSPIIIILIVAAIFSLLTKSYSDSIFIFLVIIINSIIGTYQEWNSEKSAEKLQNMIKIKVKVIREGIQKEIESENIALRRYNIIRVRR